MIPYWLHYTLLINLTSLLQTKVVFIGKLVDLIESHSHVYKGRIVAFSQA